MHNLTKTLWMTALLCLATILIVTVVQLRADQTLTPCSYLDPVVIDYLAFSAAVFLVVEGLYRIYEHANRQPLHQLTRSLRIAFGCAIITLHILQFMHK